MFRKLVIGGLIVSGSITAPLSARAGVLIGSWDVVCRSGRHTDRVTNLTRNHSCRHGDDAKSVTDGAARVKCASCGTVDLVGGVTQSHPCSHCGKEVRR